MIDIDLIGAPSFAVAVDETGFTYAAVNDRLVDLLGVPKVDFVGKTPETLLPADYAAEVLRHYRACVDERRSVEFESFYESPCGGRWWRTSLCPVFDGEEGRVVLLIGVAVDISAGKAAEARSREVEARISLAMDVLEGGFWHYSIAADRFRTSPQLSRLVTGAEAGPLDAERYSGFVLEEDRASLDFCAMLRGEADTTAAEYRVMTGAGDLRWLSCKRRLMRDDAGRPENVIGVVVDITEQKLRQDLLAAQASTDSLTDLLNRRGFEALGQRLAAGMREGEPPFGLLLIDLDRFKPVNDTHGHAVGDAVLREMAARLRRHTRPGDAAARLGGDEFAVLVRDATPDVLAGLSRRLVDAMARPIATAAGRIDIGGSVGAALWGASDRDLADLAARADETLFTVKRDGRGAWRVAA